MQFAKWGYLLFRETRRRGLEMRAGGNRLWTDRPPVAPVDETELFGNPSRKVSIHGRANLSTEIPVCVSLEEYAGEAGWGLSGTVS
jgi:hypothetical protein